MHSILLPGQKKQKLQYSFHYSIFFYKRTSFRKQKETMSKTMSEKEEKEEEEKEKDEKEKEEKDEKEKEEKQRLIAFSQQRSKYVFATQPISLRRSVLPETTHIVAFEEKEEDISMYSDVLVNCTENFTSDEKRVIGQFNINTMQELLKHKRISKRDKERCEECFAYVCEQTRLMGFEPVNGSNTIQMGKYAVSVRILPNGMIKYCKSWGDIKTTDILSSRLTLSDLVCD